jgi:LysM repeat protein
VSGSHVVQPGETLGAISARYGVSMTALVQANNLSNPSLLYVGQTLAIPGAGTTRTATVAAPTPTSTGQHAVRAGDTLFRISLQYGVSMADLIAANGLGGGDFIYTGQVLTIPNGPVSAPAPAAAAPPPANAPGATIVGGKQIVVVLSQQTVYAYENGQLLRQFVVSTGLPATPTVQGDYAIYVKYDSTRMTGPDYDLPGVPWYGFHGTYWHNNFGNPMSHGCVNMRTPEAEWLYMWAPVGTPVHIVWS